MLKLVKLLRVNGRKSRLNILSKTFHSEISQWIDRRTEPAHSAREDMSIVAVDARQGLGKIQLAEHFHFRKRTQQMSESVRHEAPIVRRGIRARGTPMERSRLAFLQA